MNILDKLALVPGVSLASFPSVTGEMCAGLIVQLGIGKVSVGIADWRNYGMLYFQSTKEQVTPGHPGGLVGNPEYDAAMANTAGTEPAVMLMFKDLAAIDNLRRSLDSVERVMRALPPKVAEPCGCEEGDLETGVVCKPCGQIMPVDMFKRFVSAASEDREAVIAEVDQWQKESARGFRWRSKD